MTKPHFLQHFKEILEREGIPSTLTKDKENNKIENLFIPFEGTNLGITLSNFNPQVVLGEEHLKINLIQYYLAIPVEVKKEQLTDVVKFINELNLFSPIPGWHLDQKNGFIHYRYIQVNSNNLFPSDELVSYLLQVIALYMNQYAPLIIDLCSGKIKYDQAIKNLKVDEPVLT
jgi:hypothetical protein